jgi:para-nitrobenzyl esterase
MSVMPRREFISCGVSSVFSAATLLQSTFPSSVESNAFTEVETTYGKLSGSSRDGVAMFKGVHYGASTGGANR